MPDPDANTSTIRASLKREVLGCLLSFLTVLAFTLGSVCVQALNGVIPDFELNAICMSGESFVDHVPSGADAGFWSGGPADF